MDELDFRLLSVLNETHNITKAADLLYLTQSAVSRRISVLEKELDVVLFTRTKQGIHFTPDGEIVFRSARAASAELQNMREALMMQRNIICGSLNLGATNNFASLHLARLISVFHARYPHVSVNIITDHSRKLANRLTSGNIDVCIVRGEQNWADSRFLMKSESICAIRNRSDEGKLLQELPYIERITSQQLTRSISKWLRENNLPGASSNIATEHIINCVQMVEEGLGWAIVPESVLDAFDGIITPLAYQDGTALTHNTWLLYADQSLNLPAAEAFVSLVRELYAPPENSVSL